MKKKLFFLFSICLLSACQTEIYYSRSIVNDTDLDIDLVFLNQNSTEEPDTIRLDARSTTIIEDYHELDSPKEAKSCAPERDRIVLKVSGFQALLRKDFFNDDNWENYISGNRSKEQDCYFEMNEDNLLLYNGS